MSATHWRRAAANSNDGPTTCSREWPKKAHPKRQEELAALSVCDLRYEEWPGRLLLLGHGSSVQVVPRLILSPATGSLTVLAPCAAGPRLFIPSIRLRSPTPRLGLVWCSGQAWIRILDLVGSQLEHIVDLSLLCRQPYGGWTRRGCMRGRCR